MTTDMIKVEWDGLTDGERAIFEDIQKEEEKAREHKEKKKEKLQPATTARAKILVKVGNMEVVLHAVADTGATAAIVNKALVAQYGLESGEKWKGELTSAG